MRSATIVIVFTFLLTAAVASATPPGHNGRIAFERLDLHGRGGALFSINPDGSGLRRLTRPPRGTEDTFPDWSPDGRRVVFTRQPPSGAYSIWVVNADGTHSRRLSPPCPPGGEIPACAADDGWAAWSPDGKHLAFQRFTGPLRPPSPTIGDNTAIFKDELVIADADGKHVRTFVWLGPYRGDPQAPSWSPDGQRLVFIGKFMTSKSNAAGCECRALYVINADGSGMHRITSLGLRPGGRPDWSPDGTSILFRTHPGDDPSGLGANLYTIRPDGTGLRQLTHAGGGGERYLEGSWSPDGRSIVFETNRGADGESNVFSMNPDGTGIRQITHTQSFEDDGDWGSAATH